MEEKEKYMQNYPLAPNHLPLAPKRKPRFRNLNK